tara:strand:- start:61 stop:525 length:465 start_codon:yes stop_codon:yes gene_type:complete
MNHFEGKSWEFYTLISLVFLTISIISRKYLFNLKCNFNDVLFFYSLFLILFYSLFLIYFYNKEKSNLFKDKKNKNTILFFTFIASFSVGFTMIIKTKAYELVSNMSYVDALMEPSKIILLYLFSVLVFGTIFKPIILLGILLALSGIIIILKYQ